MTDQDRTITDAMRVYEPCTHPVSDRCGCCGTCMNCDDCDCEEDTTHDQAATIAASIDPTKDRIAEAIALLSRFTRHYSGDGAARALAILESLAVSEQDIDTPCTDCGVGPGQACKPGCDCLPCQIGTVPQRDARPAASEQPDHWQQCGDPDCLCHDGDRWADEVAAADRPAANEQPEVGDTVTVTWADGHESEDYVRPSGYYTGANSVERGEATVKVTHRPTASGDTTERAARMLRLHLPADQAREVAESFAAAGLLAGRDRARIAKALEQHSEFRVYDECDHNHQRNDDDSLPEGVIDVDEIGLTCEDGYMYSICANCCTGGSREWQTEACGSEHKHDGNAACWPCPTRIALTSPEETQ